MSSNNKANSAIAAVRVSTGDKRTITPAAFGVSQGTAFVLAMATADERGVTLHEARVRYAAVGGPVWGENWSRADLHWFVAHPGKSGQKQGGMVHEFVHRGDPATIERVPCIGHGRNASACNATAPNMGSDSEGNEQRTWRYVGPVLPPTFDGDADATTKLAVGRLAYYVGVCASLYFDGDKAAALELDYFSLFAKANGLKASSKAIAPTK